MSDERDYWWVDYSGKQASVALERGQDLILRAERALQCQKHEEAERYFRQSLAFLREAWLWQREREYIGTYLHEVGERVHDLFGCDIEFANGAYQVSCPVMLSHSEYGFSVGGSAKVICTICGDDMLDCPHLKGRTYDGIIAMRHHDKCNICWQVVCDHTEGETYDHVMAFGLVVEMDLDHIALVKNPANPLAVITGYSMNLADLLERVPAHEVRLIEEGLFQYGDRLSCHHCTMCRGIRTEQ